MAQAPAAGYSGTPLIKKLGYKEGQRALMVAVPPTLRPVLEAPSFAWLATVAGVADVPAGSHPLDVVHLFVDRRALLEAVLPRLRPLLAADGMLWVSWPKKASRVPTDITEDVIRALALASGLVDVKVCAVDPVWSGLKLVIPLANRRARRASRSAAEKSAPRRSEP